MASQMTPKPVYLTIIWEAASGAWIATPLMFGQKLSIDALANVMTTFVIPRREK